MIRMIKELISQKFHAQLVESFYRLSLALTRFSARMDENSWFFLCALVYKKKSLSSSRRSNRNKRDDRYKKLVAARWYYKKPKMRKRVLRCWKANSDENLLREPPFLFTIILSPSRAVELLDSLCIAALYTLWKPVLDSRLSLFFSSASGAAAATTRVYV